MHKINLSLAAKWQKKNTHGPSGPKHIDISCPHASCGKPMFSAPLRWTFLQNAAHAYIECAGCDKGIYYYMVNPPQGEKSEQEAGTEIYQHG